MISSFRLGSSCRRICSLAQNRNFATLSKQDDLKLPERPKRPTSSWGLFVRDRYADIWKPGMPASEIGIILAKEWKTADKATYQEQSKNLIDSYKREMSAYQESLTPEMKEQLDAIKAKKSHTKLLRQLSKTNQPVMRRNAANFFMQIESAKIKDRLKNSDSSAIRDLFEEYKRLSPEEKQKYIDMQEEDKVRFKNEFDAWYNSVSSDTKIPEKVREMAEGIRIRYQRLGYL